MDDKTSKLFYEYGFTCGGILVTGFCQYLEKLADQESIDKFLFVSRDGYIIREIYREYFGRVDDEYLVFSRFASDELIFADSPLEYANETIRNRMYRAHSDNSLTKILNECGIDALAPYLSEAGLSGLDVLNWESYKKLCHLLETHPDVIQRVFEQSCDVGYKYYLELIGTAKKVCVVDLGWRGKSIIYLRNIMKRRGWDGEIIGALIGAENYPSTQEYIRHGVIHPFAFISPEQRVWEKSDKPFEYDEVIAMEALFSSEADTLLRYTRNDNGDIDFIYGKENANREKIREIHEGIREFCKQFIPIVSKYNLTITPGDAYEPLCMAMNSDKYRNLIIDSYEEVANAINGF